MTIKEMFENVEKANELKKAFGVKETTYVQFYVNGIGRNQSVSYDAFIGWLQDEYQMWWINLFIEEELNLDVISHELYCAFKGTHKDWFLCYDYDDVISFRLITK